MPRVAISALMSNRTSKRGLIRVQGRRCYQGRYRPLLGFARSEISFTRLYFDSEAEAKFVSGRLVLKHIAEAFSGLTTYDSACPEFENRMKVRP